MKYKSKFKFLTFSLILCLSLSIVPSYCPEIEETQGIDEKVRTFLESMRYKCWYTNYLKLLLLKLEKNLKNCRFPSSTT